MNGTNYTKRDLLSSYGYTVRLVDLEDFRKQIDDLQQQIDKLAPGEMEKIKQEKRDKLTSEERAALDKPDDKRTPEERSIADKAGAKIEVSWQEVALRAPAEHRAEARKLADDLADLKEKDQYDRYVPRHRELLLLDGPLQSRADRRLRCGARGCFIKRARRTPTASCSKPAICMTNRSPSGGRCWTPRRFWPTAP